MYFKQKSSIFAGFFSRFIRKDINGKFFQKLSRVFVLRLDRNCKGREGPDFRFRSLNIIFETQSISDLLSGSC